MALTVVGLSGRRGFGETGRRDAWWVLPGAVVVLLVSFVVYATWAAFQNSHYTFGPYLSPFYSPGDLGRLAARPLRPEAGLVAGLAAVLAGAPDSRRPGRLSPHLLLLPRRLLQGVLGRSAGLRGRRAAQDATAARTRCRSSLQNVHRYFLYCLARLPPLPRSRRLEGALVRRRRRRHALRHRRRNDRPRR